MPRLPFFSTPVHAVENLDATCESRSGLWRISAGECVTCHHQAGKDKGIPAIQGLDAETFITVIYAYKTGELENKVMQLVSGRLDDEQIASLKPYISPILSLSTRFLYILNI